MIRRLTQRLVTRAASPFVDAYTAARELFGISGGWMRHRGVFVLHAGALVNQPAVALVIDHVFVEVSRMTNEATADEVSAKTVVVLRPGSAFAYGGAEYSHNVETYDGPVVERGVVNVAMGDPKWGANLARGLSALWGSRAGLSHPHAGGREWMQ